MAYLKPPWFTVKVFNRLAIATGISHTETLTVIKGGTKEPQLVRNVRANPAVTLTTKSGAVTYVARETPIPQRPPVLSAYQKKAG